MSLRVTTIHRAGFRPNLFLGADRKLMLILIIACVLLFLSFTLAGIVAAPLLWIVCHSRLRDAAKKDPQLRTVYWRYMWLAASYPARSSPHRLRKLPGGILSSWT